MSPRFHKSITLIELLVSIVLMSLIVLSLGSINLYSHYHVINADRRAKVQNDVTYVLEHMAKNLSQAIGDATRQTVTIENPNSNTRRIRVWIDYNSNAIRDAADVEIQYEWERGPARIRYWPDYTHNSNPSGSEIISKHITEFIIGQQDNYVEIFQLTGCWDPDGSPSACGTSDNPSVTMFTRIKMSSVSTN